MLVQAVETEALLYSIPCAAHPLKRSLPEFGSYKLLKLKHGQDVLRSQQGDKGIRSEVLEAAAAAGAAGFENEDKEKCTCASRLTLAQLHLARSLSRARAFSLSLSLSRSRSLLLSLTRSPCVPLPHAALRIAVPLFLFSLLSRRGGHQTGRRRVCPRPRQQLRLCTPERVCW